MPQRWNAVLLSLGLLAGGVAHAAAGEPASGRLPAFDEYTYIEQLPEVLERAAPEYPLAAREAGVTGTVTVAALVGTDGRVRDTRVLRSVPLLDEAASACVRRWRFEPAMDRGSPVAVWVAVPIRFAIDGRSDPAPRLQFRGGRGGAVKERFEWDGVADSSADSTRGERSDRQRISAERLREIPIDDLFEHPVWPPGGRLPLGPAFDHPVWPPDRARAPFPHYEHPVWPPQRPPQRPPLRPRADPRFRPAPRDTAPAPRGAPGPAR